MSHTADVFLVDAAGRLRGRYPVRHRGRSDHRGGQGLLAESRRPRPSAAVARDEGAAGLARLPRPTVAPSSATTAADLRVLLVSSSIWAGPETPVIVTLSEPDGTPLDGRGAGVRARHRRERHGDWR